MCNLKSQNFKGHFIISTKNDGYLNMAILTAKQKK